MIRRVWRAVAVSLLVLTSGLWVTAATSPWWSTATSEPSGVSIAFARHDGWLVLVMVGREGLVRVRYVEENLTHDQPFTVRASQPQRYSFLPRPSGVFTARRTAEPTGSSTWFHLLPPLLLACAMCIEALALPLWRRWRRIKLCKCLRCAYDMRKATSQTCSECGHVNSHVIVNNAKS